MASARSSLPDKFPNGLRVLLVDDDQTCLTILEKMLQSCLYQVTKCNRAEAALAILRERKNEFDIVMSDVHMPDMDGFKLLECIGLEMDLPVIMMSADDSKNVVMKGITHGACDYLIKPIRIEVIRTLWKHVFIKWKSEQNGRPKSENVVKQEEGRQKTEEDADQSSSVNEEDWRNSKKRKDEEDSDEQGEKDEMPSSKKPRVVWSGELHQQFVDAVTQIGIDKAVPKKILELMNVPGITRENVASHLQKFRLYLKKMNEPTPQQHQTGYRNPLLSPTGIYGSSLPSISMLDRQYNPLQTRSLASSQTEAALRRSRSNILPGYDPRTHSMLRQNVGGAFNGGLNVQGTIQGSQLNGEYGSSLQQLLNIRNDYVPMPLSASTMARNWVGDNSIGGALYSSVSQPSSAVHFQMRHSITEMSGNGVHQDVKLNIERPRGFNASYTNNTGELMTHQDVSGALDTGKIALEVQQPYTDEQANHIPILCDNTSMVNADQRLTEEFSQNIFGPDFSHDDDLNALWQGEGIGSGDDLFA